MAELTSDEIKQFLITSPEIQRIVEERVGLADGEDFSDDPEFAAEMQQIQKDAKNPKKWKRMFKHSVGSEADKESFFNASELTPELTGGIDLSGGIVRGFQLGEESISVITVEKDGKIIFIEDASD